MLGESHNPPPTRSTALLAGVERTNKLPPCSVVGSYLTEARAAAPGSSRLLQSSPPAPTRATPAAGDRASP